MTKFLVGILLGMVMCAGCTENGKWSVAGGGDYETSHVRALYSPDPNGGIGFKVVSDSVIPDNTEQISVAMGPTATFYLGEAINTVADTIIPGAWNPISKAPARIYGTMSLLYETEQSKLLFTPGSEIHLMPNWAIHPIVWLDYIWTEGGSLTQDGFRATFGVEYSFK